MVNLKVEMMKLWKKTFGDSDDYIQSLFDEYFNPELVEYEQHDGKLVAALLAIPYSFRSSKCFDKNEEADTASTSERNDNNFGSVCGANAIGATNDYSSHSYSDCVNASEDTMHTSESTDNELHGLYLCGLATDESSRRKGIMSRLIEKINNRASMCGYDFTFLIPASEGLQKYYEDRDYCVAMYRQKSLFSSAHNFIDNSKLNSCYDIDKIYEFCNRVNNKNEDILCGKESKENILSHIYVKEISKIDSTSNLKIGIGNIKQFLDGNINYRTSEIKDFDFNKVADSFRVIEQNSFSNRAGLQLAHSAKDFELELLDSLRSNGKIITIEFSDKTIAAALSFKDDLSQYVTVPHVYYVDNYFRDIILEMLKRGYEDSGLEVYSYLGENDRIGLTEKFYLSGELNRGGEHVSTFESASLGNEPLPYGMLRLTNLGSVLRFAASYINKEKFSILIDLKKEQLYTLNREKASDCLEFEGAFCHKSFETEQKDSKVKDANGCEKGIDKINFTEISLSDNENPEKTMFEKANKPTDVEARVGDRKIITVRASFENGNCVIEPYEKIKQGYSEESEIFQLKNNSDSGNMEYRFSLSDVQKIIFGRPMRDGLVDSLFALPSISLSMAYLLD